jgi:hypothetical protein
MHGLYYFYYGPNVTVVVVFIHAIAIVVNSR